MLSLAILWFGSSTTPPPPSPVSKLDRRHTGRPRKRDNLLTGEGWMEQNQTTVCSSIKHSILSVKNPGRQLTFKTSYRIKENRKEVQDLSSLLFPFLRVGSFMYCITIIRLVSSQSKLYPNYHRYCYIPPPRHSPHPLPASISWY